MSAVNDKALAAGKTLEQLGYAWQGGDRWEPPLKPRNKTVFDLIDEQVALHRETFGAYPTRIILGDKDLLKVRMAAQVLEGNIQPATVKGLRIAPTAMSFDFLPWVY